MCGICGIIDLKEKKRVDASTIQRMTEKIRHRGPDGRNYFLGENIALGFTRLSIIDLEGGMQPIYNEDDSLIMICNGEIFNYIELRQELEGRGHTFKTGTDVEVIIHLYEEKGLEFLNQLNGQFAFAIYDFRQHRLFCARDHFGIIPFFYTTIDGVFVFASEIKAILEHPQVEIELDLVGLDQIFSFPALIGSRTMFKNIHGLENGHYLMARDSDHIKSVEYWDLVYPEIGHIAFREDENYYIEGLAELIGQSVRLRLRADVPVGFYISGGLDSSIVAAKVRELTPHIKRYSFSVDFEEKDKSEVRYQRIMADFIQSHHFEKLFLFADISRRLRRVVYHAEYPLKETYNTASLALSESARARNIKVVLVGEGADEWFAGYPGYKFDRFRQMRNRCLSQESLRERKINGEIWGDENLYFEINQGEMQKIKKALYSDHLNELYGEFDCLKHGVVNKERLANRDILHKRSYLDYKLRLVSHLIADHGDRMAYANSVEARYPFLDKNLVEFAAGIPPGLKLKEYEEKYILKRVARDMIPAEIIRREKFAFHAPGSPYLLKRDIEYIHDLLSFETIKRQGYFNPHTVEKLKEQYTHEKFRLNIPYESDLLIIVITFGIFLEEFKIPPLSEFSMP